MVYNVYFHPLRDYPGPEWWAASRIPWILADTSGDIHVTMTALHRQYGGVVRTAPDELSYITDNSWKQMYNAVPGFRQILTLIDMAIDPLKCRKISKEQAYCPPSRTPSQ